jgi:hypothetical protein
MKLKIKLLLCLVALLIPMKGLSADALTGDITLIWDYPAAEMETNLTFLVFHSTSITVPLTNWLVLTNVVGTNLSVKLTVIPGKNFFVMKATNFWAASDFSDVASTPALPRSDMKIKVTR